MSKLIAITGMDFVELRIPRKAFRGMKSINFDLAYVDARRLRRQKRRAIQFVDRCAADFIAYTTVGQPYAR